MVWYVHISNNVSSVSASLAYLTAKTHGLEQEVQDIASSLEMSPDEVR